MTVTDVKIGSRVYLLDGVVGEPGCVVGFDETGKAVVEWHEFGMDLTTAHAAESLLRADSRPPQPVVDYDRAAA